MKLHTAHSPHSLPSTLVSMVLFTLTGCASVSGPMMTDKNTTPAEASVMSGEVPAVSDGAVRPRNDTVSQTGAGVLAILQKAEDQAKMRRLDLSITTLERALRLEPRNPLVWHRLAAAHLQQKNYQQAAHLATKSNALIGADHPLRAQNNSIIAKTRQ